MTVSLVKRPWPYVTRLAGWSTDYMDAGTPQHVYAELLALALPVVKHYRSDLYHDAVWLRDHITDTDTLTFYYGVRESGTTLTQSDEWINATRSVNPEETIWTVAIMCDARGASTMAFSEWMV